MKTLLIDNYDSFTYNLYQYIGELGGNPITFYNDAISIEKIKSIKPTHIVISPGPGRPEDPHYFGVCSEIIQKLGKSTPILGVCLGHQGIIHGFGGKIINASKIMHGKTSEIELLGGKLFKNIPKNIEVMRYHSLVGDIQSFPHNELKITAQIPKTKTIMAVEHHKYPIYGIQFHPESIGTPYGKQIINNFLYCHTEPVEAL